MSSREVKPDPDAQPGDSASFIITPSDASKLTIAATQKARNANVTVPGELTPLAHRVLVEIKGQESGDARARDYARVLVERATSGAPGSRPSSFEVPSKFRKIIGVSNPAPPASTGAAYRKSASRKRSKRAAKKK